MRRQAIGREAGSGRTEQEGNFAIETAAAIVPGTLIRLSTYHERGPEARSRDAGVI